MVEFLPEEQAFALLREADRVCSSESAEGAIFNPLCILGARGGLMNNATNLRLFSCQTVSNRQN